MGIEQMCMEVVLPSWEFLQKGHPPVQVVSGTLVVIRGGRG